MRIKPEPYRRRHIHEWRIIKLNPTAKAVARECQSCLLAQRGSAAELSDYLKQHWANADIPWDDLPLGWLRTGDWVPYSVT